MYSAKAVASTGLSISGSIVIIQLCPPIVSQHEVDAAIDDLLCVGSHIAQVIERLEHCVDEPVDGSVLWEALLEPIVLFPRNLTTELNSLIVHSPSRVGVHVTRFNTLTWKSQSLPKHPVARLRRQRRVLGRDPPRQAGHRVHRLASPPSRPNLWCACGG